MSNKIINTFISAFFMQTIFGCRPIEGPVSVFYQRSLALQLDKCHERPSCQSQGQIPVIYRPIGDPYTLQVRPNIELAPCFWHQSMGERGLHQVRPRPNVLAHLGQALPVRGQVEVPVQVVRLGPNPALVRLGPNPAYVDGTVRPQACRVVAQLPHPPTQDRKYPIPQSVLHALHSVPSEDDVPKESKALSRASSTTTLPPSSAVPTTTLPPSSAVPTTTLPSYDPTKRFQGLPAPVPTTTLPSYDSTKRFQGLPAPVDAFPSDDDAKLPDDAFDAYNDHYSEYDPGSHFGW